MIPTVLWRQFHDPCNDGLVRSPESVRRYWDPSFAAAFFATGPILIVYVVTVGWVLISGSGTTAGLVWVSVILLGVSAAFAALLLSEPLRLRRVLVTTVGANGSVDFRSAREHDATTAQAIDLIAARKDKRG